MQPEEKEEIPCDARDIVSKTYSLRGFTDINFVYKGKKNMICTGNFFVLQKTSNK